MPNVGDRVIVEGNKVGQLRREGTMVEALGSLIKVRWTDGTESLFTPGAGSVRFEAGKGRGSKTAKTPARAAKGSPAKAAASKAAPSKPSKTAKAKIGGNPAAKAKVSKSETQTTKKKPVAKAKAAKAKKK